MAIRFHCGSCHEPIEIDNEWAGKPVACPYCRNTVTAPVESTFDEPGDEPAAPPPPPASTSRPTAGAPSYGPQSPGYGTSPYGYPGPGHGAQTPGRSTNHMAVASLVVILAAYAFGVAFSALLLVNAKDLLSTMPPADADMTFEERLDESMKRTEQMQNDPEKRGVLLAMQLASVAALVSGGLWLTSLILSLIGVSRPRRRGWAITALVLGLLYPVLCCCGPLLAVSSLVPVQQAPPPAAETTTSSPAP